MAKTSLVIAGPYPTHGVSSNGNGSNAYVRSFRDVKSSPRQPILSNFRVLARINVILRAVTKQTR